MERVAFIIEETEELIGCMLNPENIIIRRSAGIQPRQSVGGLLTGTEMADDPLLYTNGGSTEIVLRLVFDVTLPGSSIETSDVRDLTRPLWNLTENSQHGGANRGPALCRLIWGKQWGIRGVVIAVAERLESFTSLGSPRRSWLSLAMQRVAETPALVEVAKQQITAGTNQILLENSKTVGAAALRKDIAEGYATIEADSVSGERLDQLAYRYYGDASHWRRLASYNNIDNPVDVSSGYSLEMPALLE